MSCSEFRAAFHAGTDDPDLLRHLRTCDGCLDFAAHVDPDVMFRAIGGEEMVPPGGVEAFVSDVMHSVHLRNAEGVVVRHELSWPRRLAIAATIAVGVTGAGIVYQIERGQSVPQTQIVHRAPRPANSAAVQIPLTTKPIVQSYSSTNATIVEVPNEGANDTQVVLIVDENLPADL